MIKLWKALAVISVAMFFSGTVQASEQKSNSTVNLTNTSVDKNAVKQAVPDFNVPSKNTSAVAASEKKESVPTVKNDDKNVKIKIINNSKPERKLPANYKTITITGESKATESQAVAFLKKNTKDMKLKLTPEEIVRYYYKESTREGIRADLALCQALLETGFFKFGGTVKPNQNNFCGLGTISKNVAGASFKTPEIGVRAHIQHLLAYSTEREPKTKIVDPRYDLVHKTRKTSGYLTTWHALNGNWAMSNEYSEKIFDLHSKMLAMPIE